MDGRYKFFESNQDVANKQVIENKAEGTSLRKTDNLAISPLNVTPEMVKFSENLSRESSEIKFSASRNCHFYTLKLTTENSDKDGMINEESIESKKNHI